MEKFGWAARVKNEILRSQERKEHPVES